MISFIKGTVVEINSDNIIIDHNGFGYEISFAQQDRISVGDHILVYTYLHIREDAMLLYGFLTKSDREVFLRMISVKGIGPKLGLGLFFKSNSTRLITAIEEGDVTYLKTLPGIGAKTASQMVLDLKGKLIEATTNKEILTQEVQEALSGLRNLGYKPKELTSIEKELSIHKEKSVSELIKIGLQLLLKRQGG